MAGLIDRMRGFFPARQPARPFSEQGVGGFQVVGGVVVQRESHHALLGGNRWRTAADLLSNISIIASSLRYTMNLVAHPAWRCDPPNDTAEAKAAAEFMEEVMADIGTNWTRIVRRAAMYRFHGYGLSEWVAKRRPDGKIGIAAIEQRPQHTIERWDIDLNGGVQGVWQRDPNNAGREIYLPRQKLIYLVDDTLTDRPDGMGWFRHLVEPTQRLKTYLKLESLGFQRDLTGIPVGRVPLQKINQLVADSKITQVQADAMIEGMKEFCRLEMKSEHTGLILDSMTYRGKTEQGDQISQVAEWGMELLTGQQSSIKELGEAIRRIEFEMALIMGTSSMLTGREGQGSRALSEDQSRNLYLMVNATLDDMVESFGRDLVDPIWAMNGLSDDLKPTLKHEDASFKDVGAIAKMLADMAQAGAILAPDDPAINDLRNLAGISEAEPMDIETLALIRGDPTNQPDDGTGDQTGTGGGKDDPAAGGKGGKPRPKGGQGRAAKYDPSQPRVPSGSENAGEWTDGGGGEGDEIAEVMVATDETTIPAERKARIDGATTDYRQEDVASDINRALRDHGIAGLTADQHQLYIGMSDAISYNRLSEDTNLYRGFRGSVADWEGKVGESVSLGDGGFVSTTASQDIAWFYASGGGQAETQGYVLEISAPKGTNAFSYSSRNRRDPESEVVLGRKTKATVLSVDAEAGIVRVAI